MDAVTFGQKLIDTLDLDPVYVLLAHSNLPQGHLDHWLMAYWCFYHAGAACYIASRPREEFWDWMERAAANRVEEPCPLGGNAVNGGWPRGHERRESKHALRVHRPGARRRVEQREAQLERL